MKIKFSLSEAVAYPSAVDSDPSIPLVPLLDKISTSQANRTVVHSVLRSYWPDVKNMEQEDVG